MNAQKGPTAPISGPACPVGLDGQATKDSTPTFATLAADPEIAPLLDFAPVPRQMNKVDGWTAEMQRMFIAWLAWYGSPTSAADELGKARSGIDKLYKSPGADEFRAAWDAAVELAEKRRIAAVTARSGGNGSLRAPTLSRNLPGRQAPLPGPDAGQVLNEHGEWEDEESYLRRGEEAKDSINTKLLRIRRLFLQEISASAGKRAAFEILTELPIDWDKASRGEPQPDEPWRPVSQHTPDNILFAESGWSFGDIGYGPAKMAQLRAAIDELRAEQGRPAIDWSAE